VHQCLLKGIEPAFVKGETANEFTAVTTSALVVTVKERVETSAFDAMVTLQAR
jgi:hypothetical protein